MDIIEVRTDQHLDPNIRWRLRNWTKSEDERDILMRVTIQEVGEKDNTEDIWIMRGENTIGALANNIFHVMSEQDVNFFDRTNTLFR